MIHSATRVAWRFLRLVVVIVYARRAIVDVRYWKESRPRSSSLLIARVVIRSVYLTTEAGWHALEDLLLSISVSIVDFMRLRIRLLGDSVYVYGLFVLIAVVSIPVLLIDLLLERFRYSPNNRAVIERL